MVIPTWIENFRVVSTGKKSVKVYGSVINTPFGAIQVATKTFDNVKNESFVLLQMNFQIEKSLLQINLEGIEGHSGRLFKNKYIGLEAEFVYGESDELGNIIDSDGNPIYGSVGPAYEIYYSTIAMINVLYQGQDTERKKVSIFQNEKICVPFFANYYGLGYGD